MLWIIFGLMLLAAALVVAWPLYRHEQRLSLRSALSMVAVLGVSAVIYWQIGKPEARFAPPAAEVADVADVEGMVNSLAARLESNPDDLQGWKMLGRSYMVMQRYPDAIAAFERAMALENGTDGQTIVDLAEAILLSDGSALSGRGGDLFERALVMSPANPKALFYGGLTAIDRGNAMLAADRWETLLASSPPPEIEGILRQRIAEWRGDPLPAATVTAAEQAPAAEPAVAAADGPTVLNISVQLGGTAGQAIDPDTTIFVIARDPAQPSPPIAAVRRRASELPADIALSDSDSMIPGRTISGFRNIEIIARASSSGQPVAQPGDWFGSQKIDTGTTRSLNIVIDQQVP